MEIEKAIKETNINRYYSLKEYFCSDVDTFVFPKEEAIKIINYLREDFFPVTGLTLWILDGKRLQNRLCMVDLRRDRE